MELAFTHKLCASSNGDAALWPAAPEVERWTSDDVGAWLERMQLPNVAAQFRRKLDGRGLVRKHVNLSRHMHI